MSCGLTVWTWDLGGRTECNKLLKRLHDMIPDFSEKIKVQGGMYRKIQGNPQEETKSLYLRIENTFYHLYLERERNCNTTITVIDDSRVLKDYYLKWVTEKSGTTKSTGKC